MRRNPPLRSPLTWALLSTVILACQSNPFHHTDTAPAPASNAHTADLEARVARLEVRLLESDAQIEDLQGKLDDARQEAVRAMAKLQTLATRAEAASGMAEAEIAVDSLKAAAGSQQPPELSQSVRLLQMSTTEFDKSNYGGSLYLANQAKLAAGAGHGRLAASSGSALRQGEVLLAVPVRLKTVSTGNVREGPGTGFKVLFTLQPGAEVVGYSYLDTWLRVGDQAGRAGWVHYTVLARAGAK